MTNCKKIVIIHIANHPISEEQQSESAKLQLAQAIFEHREEMGFFMGDQDPAKADIEFLSIGGPNVNWIKNIHGDATIEDVKIHVGDLMRDIYKLQETTPNTIFYIWYEGVSTVAQLMGKYRAYFVKAHSERVSTDLPDGKKLVQFQHRRFWVY